MKNNFINIQKSRHVNAIKELQIDTHVNIQNSSQSHSQNGLASLQQATVSLMNQKNRNWGLSSSPFEVKRQKLNDDLWKITIENPKTHEVVLEVEGHSDKVFAYEDSLARMAEVLMEKDLKVTTQGDS